MQSCISCCCCCGCFCLFQITELLSLFWPESLFGCCQLYWQINLKAFETIPEWCVQSQIWLQFCASSNIEEIVHRIALIIQKKSLRKLCRWKNCDGRNGAVNLALIIKYWQFWNWYLKSDKHEAIFKKSWKILGGQSKGFQCFDIRRTQLIFHVWFACCQWEENVLIVYPNSRLWWKTAASIWYAVDWKTDASPS